MTTVLNFHLSGPFFVSCDHDFQPGDSLPRPRPIFCFQSEVVAFVGSNQMDYSMCFNSGRSANSSDSLANLRGCLGSSAIRVKSFPIPKRIR